MKHFDELKAILVKEQELRSERKEWVFDDIGRLEVPRWVICERWTMLEAVNEVNP